MTPQTGTALVLFILSGLSLLVSIWTNSPQWGGTGAVLMLGAAVAGGMAWARYIREGAPKRIHELVVTREDPEAVDPAPDPVTWYMHPDTNLRATIIGQIPGFDAFYMKTESGGEFTVTGQELDGWLVLPPENAEEQ